VTLDFATVDVGSCTSGSLVIGSSGDLACAFPVPVSTSGAQSVTAYDGYNTGTTTFSIEPNLTLSPNSGAVGVSVSATGTGFDASAAWQLTWNSTTTLCTGETTSDGSLACEFAVPPAAAGVVTLTADEGSNAPTAAFTVGPSFSILPTTGPVATSVAVLGTGFDASASYQVLWDDATVVLSGTTMSNGNVSGSFIVPAAPGGGHSVEILEGSISEDSSFSVNTTFSIAPNFGIAGATVTLSGTGFAASTPYSDCFQATVSACGGGSATFTTDAGGSVPGGTTLLVPSDAPGGYQVDVSVGATVAASAGFTLTAASLELTPSSGGTGSVTTLSGSGLLASTSYAYCFDSGTAACGVDAPTFITDASGDVPADVTITIPVAPAGTYDVNVSEGPTFVALATFAISPSWGPDPSSGPAGASVTASGTGFDATSAYVVEWNATVSACEGATSSTGTFSCGFVVPSVPSGGYTLTVAEGALAPTAGFVVEATATVAPEQGPVGTEVTVSGSGFPATSDFSVTWGTSLSLCSGTSAADGSWQCTGTTPDTAAGPYVLTASSGTDLEATTFTITPSISISDPTGYVGTSISVSGEGFDALAEYRVTWDVTPLLCSGTTDSSGSFGCTFSVPASVAGTHVVTVAEGAFAPTVEFAVSPSVAVTPTNGVVGSSVDVLGNGFDAASAYSILWNGSATVCSGTTAAAGGFVCSFVAPNGPGGAIPVEAVEGSNEASTTFGLGSQLSLSTVSGPVGSAATVTGAGLAASQPFTVTWNTSTTVCSGTTTSLGGFSCPFVVPFATFGPHGVSATQGALTLTIGFTVVPNLVLSPDRGQVGNGSNASGSGFDADAPYTLVWNQSVLLCSGTTNSSGGFVCPFTVPGGAGPGTVNLTASQGSHTFLVPFVVEKSPPVPPATSTSPFPWYLVALTLLIVVALLALLIYVESRRHRRSAAARRTTKAAPVDPWVETPGSGPVGPSAPSSITSPPAMAPPNASAPLDAAVLTAPATDEEPSEDIDVLINRLERMRDQAFRKAPPPEGGDAETPGR
jgi:hypothetical protein